MVLLPEQLFSYTYYTTADAPGNSLIINSDFTALADKTSPAVVDILTHSKHNRFLTDPFFQTFFSHGFQNDGPTPMVQSSGSGVIIHSQGYVLTCAHVVDIADEIYIKLNSGDKFTAKKLVDYPQIDIALLQIVTTKKLSLPFLKLSDNFPIKNGSPVAALGNGFNLGQSFTNGIISASRRILRMRDSESFSRVLQHTAVVNPGNSGGALVDCFGNLVGINNAIYSRGDVHSGVGFAIPSSIIRKYLDKFSSKYADVATGIDDVKNYISTDEADPNKAKLPRHGVYIKELSSDSVLVKAGIRVGDIIYQINNESIHDIVDWMQYEDTINPMVSHDFKILRDKKTESISVRFSVTSEIDTFKEFKINISPFDKCSFVPVLKGSKLARKFKNFKGAIRVVCDNALKEDDTSSFFGALNLQNHGSLFKNDDIILSINEILVKDQNSFESAVKKSKLKNQMNIVLIRDNSTMKLSLSGLFSERGLKNNLNEETNETNIQL